MAQSFEKLAKSCILRFDPESLRFIVKTDTEGGVQVWSQLAPDHIFSEYHVASAYNNEINLEVVLDHLLRALKSSTNALSVAMRLTKKEGIPILSIIISNQSRTGKIMSLSQDVPVRALTALQVEHIKEPIVPEPQVNILMPSLSNVRTIVDRMRSISNTLEVSASTNGEFRLKAQSELVEIVTYYKNLLNPELELSSQLDGTDGQESTSGQSSSSRGFSSAQVDIRNFIKFLYSHHVAPNNVVCCIIENFALVMHVYVNSSTTSFFGQQQFAALTYYIPVKHQ
ncbi:Checkpoint protein hus1 [Tieghemiomyces parasiticus]|uniref:Checkpoint protein n=1 Tax=Tieghemiomyces parasiticus TaxID=78921 RepID=A0A9W7ZLR4_9FUNG|nr:Checkpoint protein hus1 [Tieghemiomyces parasiticus]